MHLQVWIAQLDKQDPFNLGNAAMLEPVEPALCRMESEALIALHHPLASVRLPALQLLITARSLGRALPPLVTYISPVLTPRLEHPSPLGPRETPLVSPLWGPPSYTRRPSRRVAPG